ncbi:hypothetical protein GHA50_00070 (plasmid) [Klebsiella pneumoniae]|uniref:hypothetical protein n=1 Tax=Klebsiella pneumoniae TaxID=573 RepID=UPI001294DD7A|nr:hypothetical protein [Klebsiella pneumoniae]QGA58884.1 hypothetical protein GHA50_00070 [Klebsiella pneumoniae]
MIASTVSSLTIPFISGLLKKIGEKSAEKAISKAGEVIRSINISIRRLVTVVQIKNTLKIF